MSVCVCARVCGGRVLAFIGPSFLVNIRIFIVAFRLYINYQNIYPIVRMSILFLFFFLFLLFCFNLTSFYLSTDFPKIPISELNWIFWANKFSRRESLMHRKSIRQTGSICVLIRKHPNWTINREWEGFGAHIECGRRGRKKFNHIIYQVPRTLIDRRVDLYEINWDLRCVCVCSLSAFLVLAQTPAHMSNFSDSMHLPWYLLLYLKYYIPSTASAPSPPHQNALHPIFHTLQN